MPICYIGVKGCSKDALVRSFRETPSMVRWISKKMDIPFPLKKIKYYQLAVPLIRGAKEGMRLVSTFSFSFSFSFSFPFLIVSMSGRKKKKKKKIKKSCHLE